MELFKHNNLSRTKNIIFLYAELTPYLLGSLNYFSNKNPLISINVIYNNAFKNIEVIDKKHCKFHKKETFKSKNDLLYFCNSLNPKALFVSGRMFKDYLYVAKRFKNKTIRVTIQDTMYYPSFKQFFKKIFRNFFYKQYFDKFWGVGESQKRYGLEVGFNERNILNGFYVADKKFFSRAKIFTYHNNDLNILFIGRLVKEKNILSLVEVINKINSENKSNHIITIIGEGYLANKIKESNYVNYVGLKTQEKIIEIALDCDVFCLPSIYEPWGVVSHEMSALGLPILASELCGSSYDLVHEGYNGFKFNPYNKMSIKTAFENFISLSAEAKRELSSNSIKISKKITHENWNQSILSIIN